MANYIDGYVFPVKSIHLNEYKAAAKPIAEIWKEHGALAYFEYVGDDLKMEAIRSFPECLGTKEGETIVFGWIVFESREVRDEAHQKVAADSRMEELIRPLTDPSDMIFDAKHMVYGGFKPLINVS